MVAEMPKSPCVANVVDLRAYPRWWMPYLPEFRDTKGNLNFSQNRSTSMT